MIYLFYNDDIRIIKILFSKLSQHNTVISSKSLNDISKFKPDKVICFQNEDVIDKCIELNKKCIHVTEKQHRSSVKNLLQLYSIFFNLENIKYKTTYSFSMLDETSSEIIRLSNTYTEGEFKIINENYIHANNILNFYNLKRNLESTNLIKTDLNSNETIMKNINDYFIDNLSWKVNIYLPTYYRFKKTKKSVSEILKVANNSKYDVEVYVGDNNTKNEEMKKWLKTLKCHVFMNEKNTGKSGIVNHMHKKVARKCDFIFSIDSDLYPHSDSKNFIDEMIFCLTRCQNVGLVSSNQKQFSQHWWNRTVFEEEWEGVKLGISTNGIGIAGGCVVMKTKDWEHIGMYKENHDIYTGDDGIITANVIKKLGKQPVIMKDCYMVHEFPSEDEQEYTKWKMESWKRDNTQFMKDGYRGENKKGFYDD